MTFSFIRRSRYARLISLCLTVTFVTTMVITPRASFAQEGVLGLPQPGTMVNLSPSYVPLMITGLTVHPENPLLMDFIVSTGNSGMNAVQVKKESDRLIKYFLACLTIPENDQWVNLSPYEKQRIVPEDLGQTVLGQDMLAQDYLLKQLTASLIYPEKNLGKSFWDKVYAKASQMYGTTQIPVNTFNKVWILPDTAKVFEHKDTVFVVKSHLKVMLDEDYLALNKHTTTNLSFPNASVGNPDKQQVNTLGSQIVRQVVLPAIEQEVNTGKNFAQLRQIYNSMILAVWFKKNLKQALLNQVYTDKSKVNGVNADDPAIKEKIYKQYLEAYKKGVFNYIKEEVDQSSQQVVPRKYFSGGLTPETHVDQATADEAMQALGDQPGQTFRVSGLTQNANRNPIKNNDRAMTAEMKERLAAGYRGAGFNMMAQRIEQGVFNERQGEVLDVLLQEGQAQGYFGDWEQDPVDFQNDEKRAMLDELIALEDGILKEFGGIKGYIGLEARLAQRAQEGFNPIQGKTITTPEGEKLTVIDKGYFNKGQEGLTYLNRVAFQKVAAGSAQRLNWNGPQADLPYDVLSQGQRGGKSFIEEDIEQIVALEEQYKKLTGEQVHVPYVLYIGQEYIQQVAQYLKENNYFGMDGVSIVDPNKGIEEGQVLKQIVLTWQTKALGFKDRKLVKSDKYALNHQPLGHGWVHPDFGKIGLTEYLTEKLGPEARTIFFQASNPLVWYGIMQAINETFKRDDDLNVIAVSVKPGEPVGRLVLANGELTNVEYNYFDKGAVKERIDSEGNSEYGGNINVFIVKNAPYLKAVNDKNNWVEGINRVFAWLYNPKPGKVIRPETNMQDIYRFFKKVGVTIFDRYFVFAAVKNDLVEAQKAVAKGVFPEDTMSVLGMKWRALRRILAESGLKFTGPIDGEKKTLFFKGEGSRPDMGTEWYDGAKFSINPQWGYTFRGDNNVATKNAAVVLDNISKSGVGDRSVEFENVTIDGTLIIRAVPGVSLKVHDFDFGTKDQKGRSTTWHFEPLSLGQILAKNLEGITPVEQKSGYVLVKDGPGWVFEIKEPGNYEIGSDGQLKRLDTAMIATAPQTEAIETLAELKSTVPVKSEVIVTDTAKPEGTSIVKGYGKREDGTLGLYIESYWSTPRFVPLDQIILRNGESTDEIPSAKAVSVNTVDELEAMLPNGARVLMEGDRAIGKVTGTGEAEGRLWVDVFYSHRRSNEPERVFLDQVQVKKIDAAMKAEATILSQAELGEIFQAQQTGDLPAIQAAQGSLKKTLLNDYEQAWQEYLAKNPGFKAPFDLGNPDQQRFVYTKEDADATNLLGHYKEFVKKSNNSTAGIRAFLDILHSENPNKMYNDRFLALLIDAEAEFLSDVHQDIKNKISVIQDMPGFISDLRKNMGAENVRMVEEIYGMPLEAVVPFLRDNIVKLVGGEVRPHTAKFEEMESRILAQRGIKVITTANYSDSVTIYMFSYLTYLLGAVGATHYTSSHSSNYLAGRKALSPNGSQLLPDVYEKYRTILDRKINQEIYGPQGQTEVVMGRADNSNIFRTLTYQRMAKLYSSILNLTPEDIKLINESAQKGHRIVLNCLNGSTWKTLQPLMENLGIDPDVFIPVMKEEDPYFNVGYMVIQKRGRSGEVSYTIDHLGVDTTMPFVARTIPYPVLLKGMPVGTRVYEADPDSDRFVFKQILEATPQAKELLAEYGIDYYPLEGNKILIAPSPNKSFLMLDIADVEGMIEKGTWDNYLSLYLITYVSSRAWTEFADAVKGLLRIMSMVGFKNLSDLQARVEDWYNNRPGEAEFTFLDNLGREITIDRHKQIRIHAKEEESGGRVAGLNSPSYNVLGQKVLAMPEKSAADSLFSDLLFSSKTFLAAANAMPTGSESNGSDVLAKAVEGDYSFLNFLKRSFEKYHLKSKIDVRIDIIHGNQGAIATLDFAEQQKAMARSEAIKTNFNNFFFSVAKAVRNGTVSLEKAKNMLTKVLPKYADTWECLTEMTLTEEPLAGGKSRPEGVPMVFEAKGGKIPLVTGMSFRPSGTDPLRSKVYLDAENLSVQQRSDFARSFDELQNFNLYEILKEYNVFPIIAQPNGFEQLGLKDFAVEEVLGILSQAGNYEDVATEIKAGKLAKALVLVLKVINKDLNAKLHKEPPVLTSDQVGLFISVEKKLDVLIKRKNGADHAVLAIMPGGIDLSSRNLKMQSEGQKVNITFDPVMIARFRRGDFSGIRIQILDVVPVNLMPLLGLKEDEAAGQVVKA